MNTVEATIWRKAHTTNSYDIEFNVLPDQAKVPDDIGKVNVKGKSKAGIQTEADIYRGKGYGIVWRLGGFVE